ncbi:MAG: VOC family protein [Clostridia bacterium]|nr:VOC family protein [Clostridia bacterium]
MSYQSQITFLYFDDLSAGKYFFETVLKLKKVYEPDWAAVYKVAQAAYIGAVDAKKGSISSIQRGGALVSLTVDDVMPYYKRLQNEPQVDQLSAIRVFEDIGIKSFFFDGPNGYHFEIQQFISDEFDFSNPK